MQEVAKERGRKLYGSLHSTFRDFTSTSIICKLTRNTIYASCHKNGLLLLSEFQPPCTLLSESCYAVVSFWGELWDSFVRKRAWLQKQFPVNCSGSTVLSANIGNLTSAIIHFSSNFFMTSITLITGWSSKWVMYTNAEIYQNYW